MESLVLHTWLWRHPLDLPARVPCVWALECNFLKAAIVNQRFISVNVCVVKRDHVAHTVIRLPATYPPALPTSDFCPVLAPCVVNAVSLHGNRADLPAHSKHGTWQTKGYAGCCGDGGAGPCGSVPGCALCRGTCGWEALHATRCPVGLVRRAERHSLPSRLPADRSQRRARHHDAGLGHLQPWHGRYIPARAEWRLSVYEHIRTNTTW